MSLDILPVNSRRRLRDFIRVPWPIYEDDPAWVPPLFIERSMALAPGQPFFAHAVWQGWVACRDGRAIGRISAQIDDLHQQRYGDHTGYFGMFEAPDDPGVAAALFDTAGHWLRERGMRRALGPFNLGINQEIGLLVEGFDQAPNIMMGHARPYYAALVEGCGYRYEKDVLAYDIDRQTDGIAQAMAPFLRRLPANVTIRQLDKRAVDRDLDLLRDIFNDAWSNNWGFVPFTQAEFRAIGHEMLMLIPPDFIQIAEIGGTGVAFITLLPNINEAIADLNGRLLPLGWLKLLWRLKVRSPGSGRVALMGVRKALQRTRQGPGIAYAVIGAARAAALRVGMTRVEFSWILEDNKPVRHILEMIGARITKRYRIYGKALASA